MAGSPDRSTYQPIRTSVPKRQDSSNLLYMPPIPDDLNINVDEGRWREEDLLKPHEEVYHFMRYGRGREAQETIKNKLFEDEEHKAELESWVREGMESREEIVGRNLRLVASIARKRIGHGLPASDLHQEGCVGLLSAIDRFDWTRGYKFSTYATWWIRQSVNRAISDQARTIRIPEHALGFIRRLGQANTSLEQELGREPTIEELALAVDSTSDKIREVYRLAQSSVSLETPITDNGGMFEEIIPADQKDTIDLTVLGYRDKAISKALAHLPDRLRLIIEMRFGLYDGKPKTLASIGEELGLSRERVRQLEIQGMAKLRRPEASKELKNYYE